VGVDQDFVLNGCRVTPSVLETPRGARAREEGALVQLAEHRILVHEPGDLYFVSTSRGRLERIQEDGRRRLVSLHVEGEPNQSLDVDSLGDTRFIESLTLSCIRVSPFPVERFPSLRRIELVCTDWSEEDSLRLLEARPHAQIRSGFRSILLDVLRPAVSLRVRALPWPGGGVIEERLYETGDSAELAAFQELLQFEDGYRNSYLVPSPAHFGAQFLGESGQVLAELRFKGEGHAVELPGAYGSSDEAVRPRAVLGTCSSILCSEAWPVTARVPRPQCDQLRDWLVARGVPRSSWERRPQR
jgi:hypothetical protein